jgi:hypothetical protein
MRVLLTLQFVPSPEVVTDADIIDAIYQRSRDHDEAFEVHLSDTRFHFSQLLWDSATKLSFNPLLA